MGLESVQGFRCEGCGQLTEIEPGAPPPPGWYLTLRRIRDRKHERVTNEASPYFCSKECMINGLQFHGYSDVERVEIKAEK